MGIIKPNKIKEFWQNQANLYKELSTATSPDSIAFEMEINALISNIPNGSKILDIGCGNGIKGEAIVTNLECQYFGIDYSPNMIYQAKNRIKKIGVLQNLK